MARSESQGLQIAVILLTMCVVGLAIFTWVFYQSADKHFKLAEAANQKAVTADNAAKKQAYVAKVYQYITGNTDATKAELDQLKTTTGGDATAEEALAKYEKQMIMVTEATTPDAKGLAKIPEYLTGTIVKRNQDLVAARTLEESIKDEKAATETREQERAKTAETGMQKAAADLAAERQKFNDERTDFKKKQDELVAQIAAKDKQIKEQKEEADKRIVSLTGRIEELDKLNAILKRKLDDSKKDGPSFEAPDGEITWVNQRERLAWIDVGYADGVMRQMTFSVYDHDENGVSSAVRKASIEVIRVPQAHLAECRILEDEIKNPILPGDKIFTPAWSPGQKLHFALSGNIDIDGDGRADNDEIKNIIRLNGAELDAEVTSTGKRSGTITSQTRYLIRGKAPSERELSAEEGKKALDEYTDINNDAEAAGTEIIDVTRFLALMGWKAQDRTTTLGSKRTTGRRGQSGAEKAELATEPAETTTEPEPTPEAPADKPKPADDDNPFD